MKKYTLCGALILCLMSLTSTATAQDPGMSQTLTEWGMGNAMIVPSISFNIGGTSELVDRSFSDSNLHLSLWLGAEAHPFPGEFSPYIAAGVELEPHSLSDDSRGALYIMPMARAGFAWTSCLDDESPFLSTMFPCMNMYGMLGMRPGSFTRETAARVGVGINSPLMLLAGLAAQVVLPTHYEFLVEFNPIEKDPMYLFRVGFGF